jgi:small subunit ribosomal protein S6
LAYPVKKNERGIYYVLYYTAEGSIIAEFERRLRFNEDVLKFLTIKYRTKKEISKFEMFVSKINGTIEVEKKEEAPQKPKVEEAKEESVKAEEPKKEETATTTNE